MPPKNEQRVVSDSRNLEGLVFMAHTPKNTSGTMEKYRIRYKDGNPVAIASGAFATAYVATCGKKGCEDIVIKVLQEDVNRHKEERDQFSEEAKVAGVVKHDNIVEFLGSGEAQDKNNRVVEVNGQRIAYIAMEKLPMTLAEAANTEHFQKRLDARSIASLFSQIASALEYAEYNYGIKAHRDLHPGNIFISFVDGEYKVKIGDFGRARLMKRPDQSVQVTSQIRKRTIGENDTQSDTIHFDPESCIAPEVNIENCQDNLLDTYSLGKIGSSLLVELYYKIDHENDDPAVVKISHIFDRAAKNRKLQKMNNIKDLADFIDQVAQEAGIVHIHQHPDYYWNPDKGYRGREALLKDIKSMRVGDLSLGTTIAKELKKLHDSIKKKYSKEPDRVKAFEVIEPAEQSLLQGFVDHVSELYTDDFLIKIERSIIRKKGMIGSITEGFQSVDNVIDQIYDDQTDKHAGTDRVRKAKIQVIEFYLNQLKFFYNQCEKILDTPVKTSRKNTTLLTATGLELCEGEPEDKEALKKKVTKHRNALKSVKEAVVMTRVYIMKHSLGIGVQTCTDLENRCSETLDKLYKLEGLLGNATVLAAAEEAKNNTSKAEKNARQKTAQKPAPKQVTPGNAAKKVTVPAKLKPTQTPLIQPTMLISPPKPEKKSWWQRSRALIAATVLALATGVGIGYAGIDPAKEYFGLGDDRSSNASIITSATRNGERDGLEQACEECEPCDTHADCDNPVPLAKCAPYSKIIATCNLGDNASYYYLTGCKLASGIRSTTIGREVSGLQIKNGVPQYAITTSTRVDEHGHSCKTDERVKIRPTKRMFKGTYDRHGIFPASAIREKESAISSRTRRLNRVKMGDEQFE